MSNFVNDLMDFCDLEIEHLEKLIKEAELKRDKQVYWEFIDACREVFEYTDDFLDKKDFIAVFYKFMLEATSFYLWDNYKVFTGELQSFVFVYDNYLDTKFEYSCLDFEYEKFMQDLDKINTTDLPRYVEWTLKKCNLI